MSTPKRIAVTTAGGRQACRLALRRTRDRAHAAVPRRQPGHEQAERLLVGLLARQVGDDASLEHHEDAVGKRQDLGELGRDEQDGVALVALGEELAVDELDGADVDAARRLLGDQHRRAMGKLARDHDLLQVAAGERSDRQLFAGDPDVEARDQLARQRCQGRRGRSGPRRASGGRRWKPMARFSAALRRERRADGGAVLGDMGEPGGAMAVDARRRHVDAVDL